MTPEERIKILINSMGALSELMFIYFNNLMKAGFTETQALYLVDQMVKGMLEKEK